MINMICDSALLFAFSDEIRPVGAAVIEQVLHERDGVGMQVQIPQPPKPAAESGVESGGAGERR